MRLLQLPIPIPLRKEREKREQQKSQLHLRQTVRLNKRLMSWKINKQEVCELKSLYAGTLLPSGVDKVLPAAV